MAARSFFEGTFMEKAHQDHDRSFERGTRQEVTVTSPRLRSDCHLVEWLTRFAVAFLLAPRLEAATDQCPPLAIRFLTGGPLVVGTEQQRRDGLWRLERQAADHTEIFEIASQKHGATEQSGGGNQSVSDGDGIAAAQLSGMASNTGGDGDAGQHLQQREDRAFFPWGQCRTSQQLAFRDDRNGSSNSPAGHILHDSLSVWITPQVIDQNVRVQQVLRQLRNLTPEPRLPLTPECTLVCETVGQSTPQESGGLADNPLRFALSGLSGGSRQFERPLHGLELILQAFQLGNHRHGFHRGSLA